MSNRWSGVAFTALKMSGLYGMEKWSLGVGCGLMDAHRLVVLSSVVVMSMVNGPGKVYAMISPEDGMAEDGGGIS